MRQGFVANTSVKNRTGRDTHYNQKTITRGRTDEFSNIVAGGEFSNSSLLFSHGRPSELYFPHVTVNIDL